MPIIQTSLYVEPDVYSKLVTNEYSRHGGIVRNKSGSIVSHLPDTDSPEREHQFDNRATTEDSDYSALIPWLVAALLAIATFGIYTYFSRKKAKQKSQQIIHEFKDSLVSYLEQAKSGKLTPYSIDRLICALDDVESGIRKQTLSIDFSMEELIRLVWNIRAYTYGLANANSLKIVTAQQSPSINPFTALHEQLNIQKSIFEKTKS